MRRIFIVVMILTLSFVMIFSTQSCNKEESIGTEYTIPIDSIFHADTINIGEVLTIEYYGLIGLSDCFSYDRIDVAFESDIINTTVIGLYIEDEDCSEEISYLSGEEARIYSLPQGDYIINVNLPRNQILESKVYVK